MSPFNQLQRQQALHHAAHDMRMAPSEPEAKLWRALRCCRLGVRFRRQVVFGSFIVDFFAPSARLVVEVDGAQHVGRRNADKRRDAWLEARGLRVLRLPAGLVCRNLEGAIRAVEGALARPGWLVRPQ